MEKNKTGKYLKYAIGEIILVVIGILIALSINNWNEARKTRLIEFELLQNIQSDLIESKKSIDKMLQSNSNQIALYKQLQYRIKNDLPETENLNSTFGKIPTWSTPYLNYSAYETLKTKGVDLIQNDSLTNDIINIYDNEFAYLVNDWDKWEWNTNQNITMPFFVKHFERDSINLDLARPNDFESLKDNQEFSNLISTLLFLREKGVRHGNRIGLKVDTLITSIENELLKR
jgi:hypothetical protein